MKVTKSSQAASPDDVVDGKMSVGEYLRRKMAVEGLSASALANELEVHPQTIYNVTTGKRSISSKLALKLAARFVESVDFWLSEEVTLRRPAGHLPGGRGRADGGKPRRGAEPIMQPLLSASTEQRSSILVDHAIERLLGEPGGGVRIVPFDPQQVQPASYDLTIGIVIRHGFRELSLHEWRLVLELSHTPEGGMDAERRRQIESRLKEKGAAVHFERECNLDRGDSVVIIAREHVSFDKWHLAEVGGTARNAINGLLVNYGFQIDPGYSGPIIVTAMNIGHDPVLLREGEKIVSLAISRLTEPPRQAYENDLDRMFLGICLEVAAVLRGLFEFKPLGRTGEHKAYLAEFDESFVDASAEDVAAKAIDWLIGRLAAAGAKDAEALKLSKFVLDSLEQVTVTRKQMESMVQYFRVNEVKALEKTRKKFRHRGDKQTLIDVIGNLGLALHETIIELATGENHSD